MSITSKTEACNLALSGVSCRRINSFESEATEEAICCRLHFQPTLDGLLRNHQWSFATDTATLSALPNSPSSKWAKAWQLPANFVRHISVTGGPLFAIHGRQLLTNAGGPIEIEYVRNDVPITYWDSLFLEAFTYALGAKIAKDVKKSQDDAATCLTELKNLALPAAQTVDAREVLSGENMTPAILASMSPLVNARFRRSAPSARPGLPPSALP